MTHHTVCSLRAVARISLTTVLIGWLTLPGRSESPEVKPRDQAIADIEKQIAALSQQLAELKKTSAPPPTELSNGSIPQSWVSSLPWRSIGPATMGGRITAISVFNADPTTYWIASASGGLLKTVNNGVTFEHQFDKESTVSIGDVCVAPSDRSIVWVGTGEGNPRNSVSYGDGIYKSTDGGKTWKNMGLHDSFQIGRIVIHPTDPNIVYVGALGRLYGDNPDRGVFKTTDGGKTWEKVLYVDDKTGCIDLRMNPGDPNTLLAAMWERKRDGFDSFLGDSRPTDGRGQRMAPLSVTVRAAGCSAPPTAARLGRKSIRGCRPSPRAASGWIGIARTRRLHLPSSTRKKPAPASHRQPQSYVGFQGEEEEGGNVKITQIFENAPSAKAGLKVDDLVTALDGKPIGGYEKMLEFLQEKKVGDKVKFTFKRAGSSQDVTVTLEARPTTGPAAAGGGGGRGAGGGGGRGGRGAGGAGIAADQPWPGFFARDTEDGVRVRAVTQGSSAEKAGIKADDVILEVNGKKTGTFRELLEDLQKKKIGDKVKVTFERGEAKKTVEVALEQFRPQAGGFGGGGQGGASASRPYGSTLGGQAENRQSQQGPDGPQTGGVYKSTDSGETWTRINSINPRPMYFSQVRVDPSDDKLLYVLGVSFYASTDGGRTFRLDRPSNGNVHSDEHALWIDPKDGRHMLIGTDGGFYVTYDRTKTWEHLTLADLGQFYHVCLDNRKPYHVYGGLQDNGSWGGPSRTLRSTGPINEDWFMVGGGDGFVCRVDPEDPDLIYSESQDGAVRRRNMRTGEGASLRPRPAGGQGGGQGGGRRGGGQGGGQQHRYNWNTPFILSVHNPGIVYVGAEMVFRSLKHGDDMKAGLTRN